MKKLTATLALLVFAGNIASAELLKNFKWDGKILVNAYSTKNDTDLNSDAKDTTSDVDTRVELNAGFNLTEDVDAVVSAVKADQQYGRVAGQSVANGTINNFFFEQAYLDLKGILGIDHKVGRQYYGEAGDLVVRFGPSKSFFNTTAGVTVGNELNFAGVDGWTGWYKNDKLSVHGVAAKITANSVAAANTDTDLTGVVGRYGLMELLNIGAYVYEAKKYNDASPVTGASNADSVLNVIGVKADGKFSPLNLSYYGELAKNYGHDHTAGVAAGHKNSKLSGTGFLAGAKMDMDLVGKWTFSGEMAMGTGDKDANTTTNAADDNKTNKAFTDISSDYRPGIIFGGVKGMNGIGNLTTWNLGAKWNTPMFEQLTLGGKLYHFGLTEKMTKTAGGNNYKKETYGNELDLTAKWQHNENVGLTAYYAAFIVDSDAAKYDMTSLTAKDDMITTLGLALNVKF